MKRGHWGKNFVNVGCSQRGPKRACVLNTGTGQPGEVSFVELTCPPAI
jgi:hypothetical protein